MVAPRTVRLLPLSCKVSQYETQYVKDALAAAGPVEAEDGARADLYAVNTCSHRA
jgi:tRNA A37 methylthiotransferase MiaB